MGLRQRERITRHPDKGQCDACGKSQFEHDISRKKVAGQWLELCTTCFIEEKHDRLLKHLAIIEEVQDADVDQELMADLVARWRA